MNITRIDQFLAGVSPYDAISNEAFLIKNILNNELGIKSEIYALHISRLLRRKVYYYLSYNKFLHQSYPVIYHFSIGSEITNYLITQLKHVLIRYHNITPHYFFSPITQHQIFSECLLGRRQIKLLGLFYNQAFAVSEFNKSDLMNNNFTQIKVLPLLRDYEQLARYEVNPIIKDKMLQKPYNILFVGRISYHKCQHDLILYLFMLKKYFNPQIRLILIGSSVSHTIITHLHNLCKDLSLTCSNMLDNSDVIFLSKVSEQDLSTYYRYSSLFLCLSEHEGFCAPLVEAMYLGLPVVAHNIPAVAETISNGGILINKYNCEDSLNYIIKILSDENFKKDFIQKAYHRANSLSFSKIKNQFITEITNWLSTL